MKLKTSRTPSRGNMATKVGITTLGGVKLIGAEIAITRLTGVGAFSTSCSALADNPGGSNMDPKDQEKDKEDNKEEEQEEESEELAQLRNDLNTRLASRDNVDRLNKDMYQLYSDTRNIAAHNTGVMSEVTENKINDLDRELGETHPTLTDPRYHAPLVHDACVAILAYNDGVTRAITEDELLPKSVKESASTLLESNKGCKELLAVCQQEQLEADEIVKQIHQIEAAMVPPRIEAAMEPPRTVQSGSLIDDFANPSDEMPEFWED